MRLSVFILRSGAWALLSTGALADQSTPHNLDIRPSCGTLFESLYTELHESHHPTRRLLVSQADVELAELKNHCTLVCAVNLTQVALAATDLPLLPDPRAEVHHWENYWTEKLGQPDRPLSGPQTAQTLQMSMARHLPGSEVEHQTISLPLSRARSAAPESRVTERIRFYDLVSSHSARNSLETKKLTLLGVNADGKVTFQHAAIVTGRGRINDIPYVEISDPNFSETRTKLAAFPLRIENCNGHPDIYTVELSYLPGENPYLNSDAEVRSFFVGAVTTINIKLQSPSSSR